tara:strand:- start:831 stop:953 length:123 start_codon:yes stop_codon:yes gene_type:complete
MSTGIGVDRREGGLPSDEELLYAILGLLSLVAIVIVALSS